MSAAAAALTLCLVVAIYLSHVVHVKRWVCGVWWVLRGASVLGSTLSCVRICTLQGAHAHKVQMASQLACHWHAHVLSSLSFLPFHRPPLSPAYTASQR